MKLRQDIRAFFQQEDGVGVIEVVLILVVLIGLVLIFKSQIRDLLENIFKEITPGTSMNRHNNELSKMDKY